MTDHDTELRDWPDLLDTAADRFGTPCYVATWRPFAEALDALQRLLPAALAAGWRVGIRCHAPDERDARDPRFGGQFGMTEQDAAWALRTLRTDVRGVHFHVDPGGGLPALEEMWLENGRFVTDASTALVVRVLDIKERADSRYLMCDEGRTNHALSERERSEAWTDRWTSTTA